ncbi:C163A protein, partial [Pitta sordida]|nr:C163A protein [Pitta sordida]
RGQGPIWLDEVECGGHESSLPECPAKAWGDNNCFHGEDAGVVCSGADLSGHAQVRLADGPHRCAGRVEVFRAGQWGTVCDDTWDMAAATVVCRHLSCGAAIAATPRARFGKGSGPIWLDRVTCDGSEGHLDECRHRGWGVHSCDHVEDAGAVCA